MPRGRSFESLKAEHKDNEVNSNNKQEQLDLLQNRLNKLLDKSLGGLISDELFKSKQKQIVDEIDELKSTEDNQTNEINEVTFGLLEEFKEKALNLDILFSEDDEEIKRDILSSAVSDSRIENGQIASVCYKQLYSYIAKAGKTRDLEIWRRGRDSCRLGQAQAPGNLRYLRITS